MTSPSNSLSQTDTVIEGVKAMIASGALGPGSRMPVEADLAVQLGVSRGPLREGVRALVALGILETRQGDGTYVTSLDPALLLAAVGVLADLQSSDGVVQLLEVRRILESETAARAAIGLSDAELTGLENLLETAEAAIDADGEPDYEAFIDADIRFHAVIAAASANPTLAALVDGLGGRTARARLWRAISAHGSVTQTQAEHRAILVALRRRDPERARLRMALHILGVEEFWQSHGTADAADV
jgi:GntR family transcriptional repressor for pyruvate dehydrogenase complex